jgi:uncharacterized phage infection (PIP) family protein YhgE
MPDTSIQLSPRKLKNFIRHLCLAAKAIEEKDRAKQELNSRLMSLRKMAASKKHTMLSKGLKDLEEHIDRTIEKEKKAAYLRAHEPLHEEKLRTKMQELDSKLKVYTDAYSERQEKIAKLEKKISNRTERNKEISEIRSLMASLDRKYDNYPKNSSDAKLAQIKEKIDLLKLKLEKL